MNVSAHSFPSFLLTDTDLPFVLLHSCPPGSADLAAFRKDDKPGRWGLERRRCIFVQRSRTPGK